MGPATVRARIGVVDERLGGGFGVFQMVAHIYPLDTDAALAEDVVYRLTGVSPRWVALCGERALPHFVPGGGRVVFPLKGWIWCPVCAERDVLRLPP